jgi:transcriptional regulator of arginine metabolism
MKARRHFAIRDILVSELISTQEELCEALRKRGYDVTQATVSRDIKELRLTKVPDNKGYHYALPDVINPKSSLERMKRVFKDSVINVDYSENIIVIKTLPGTAQTVGYVIDAMDNANILGNVAGDDTIFVLIKPIEQVAAVLEEFKRYIEG